MEKRKVIALLLALALVAVPVLRPVRAGAVAPGAGLVTVAGGAIGTGGLAGGAAVGSTVLPVLGVLGLALAAAGLTLHISNEAAAAGLTRTEYITQKLEGFASATGQTTDRIYNDISGQLEATSDGSIIIGRVAADVIGRFGDWLFSTGAVSTPVEKQQVSVIKPVNGLTNPFTYYTGMVSVYRYDYSAPDGVRMAVICDSDTNNPGRYYYYVIFAGLAPATVSKTLRGDTSTSSKRLSESSYNGRTFYYTDYSVTPTVSITANQAGVTGMDVYNLGYQAWRHSYDVAVNLALGDVTAPDVLDGFSGHQQTWEQNRDLLKPGEDGVTVLTPPDVLNPAGAAAGAGEYTVSVPDYLTALADAYNAGATTGTAAITVPLTNTATGVQTAATVSTAAVTGNPSLATADVDGFSGTSGLVDPEAEPSASDVLDSMKIDVKLSDFFPFSIPYNFFSLLDKFKAVPVAPVWDFDYTFPLGDGVDVHYHMDLSPYEGWAFVIRWAFRVGWIATLAGAAQRRIKF